MTYLERKEPSLRLQVLPALEGAVWTLYEGKYRGTVLVEFIYGKISGYYLKQKKETSIAMKITEFL